MPNMTGAELRLHRKALLLSVSDSARIIGRCSDRAWRYWEDGRRTVPKDVADTVAGLISYRNAVLRGEAEIASDEIGKIIAEAVKAVRLGSTQNNQADSDTRT